jgi:hypothetical protein
MNEPDLGRTPRDPNGTTFSDAQAIRAAERDVHLRLNGPKWPPLEGFSLDGWAPESAHLRRTILPEAEDIHGGPLNEYILRFPSAHLHGLQRLHGYHVPVGLEENFHTYRVLCRSTFSGPARRIFLIHNGLNELARTGFYYQLASYILRSEDEDSVCILRPFPGHLTRHPLPAYGETPLDRYLWDGSYLFRQFLRYMVETQWFLSVIVRRSQYLSPSGANLLVEDKDPIRSRLETSVLTQALHTAWTHIHEVAHSQMAERHRKDPSITELSPPSKDDAPISNCIYALRELLGLSEQLGPEDDDDGKDPQIHAVGYSLGGFTAQSVFMTWPYVIASCSTLLSGGALRELAPTAFADPEEWQTVLHSLRDELDDAMMSRVYDAGATEGQGETVAGMNGELFRHLKRIFYEVFQQEYHGSFQTRLAAFRQRMFFVVGGNDPIVRPEIVLDSSPKGGMNLLEVGGLSHFLDGRPQDAEEKAQRRFWLPQVGRLIARFGDDAARLQAVERAQSRAVSESPQDDDNEDVEEFGRLTIPEQHAIDGEGRLPGALFERCLDDLLARQVAGEGLLLILRNDIPTFLLEERAIQAHAALLYHDDAGILRYARGIRRRHQILVRRGSSITIVLPWNASLILRNRDAHPGFPSQAECAGSLPPEPPTPAAILGSCIDACSKLTTKHGDTVMVFDGRPGLPDVTELRRADATERDIALADLIERASRTPATGKEALTQVASLPDCWIWMSREYLRVPGKRPPTMAEDGTKIWRNALEAWEGYDKKKGDRQEGVRLIEDKLSGDHLRVITVSRARFNPRYRGRILTDGSAVRQILLHAALCHSLARGWTPEDFRADPGRETPRPDDDSDGGEDWHGHA